MNMWIVALEKGCLILSNRLAMVAADLRIGGLSQMSIDATGFLSQVEERSTKDCGGINQRHDDSPTRVRTGVAWVPNHGRDDVKRQNNWQEQKSRDGP